MPDTTQPNEELLPKHGNGTTERLHRLTVPKNLQGIFEAECEMFELTANEEIDPGVSRSCGVHGTNAIAAIKTTSSLIRYYERAKTKAAKQAYLMLMREDVRTVLAAELLALEAPRDEPKVP